MMASIHDGHRERMRKRYLKSGLDGFEKHEALEMLLYFALRQGDTNELAHRLMEHFGSFSGVLRASMSDLMQVNGVGESTAMLISMILPLYRVYRMETGQPLKSCVGSEASGEYLMSYFADIPNEHVVAMLLDNNCRVITMIEIGEGAANTSGISMEKLLEGVLRHKATGVVLAHNHPFGRSLPSRTDLNCTITIRNMLSALHVQLYDHIIVGEDESGNPGYTSMALSEAYRELFQ